MHFVAIEKIETRCEINARAARPVFYFRAYIILAFTDFFRQVERLYCKE
jgi:hypothetical protein